MLVFSALVPHPPMIVSGIGTKQDRIKVKNTILAMEKLAEKIVCAEPDVLIIISPHAIIHLDKMAVYGAPKLIGDFAQFGAKNISFQFDNDIELAKKITDASNEAGIGAFLFGNRESDYSELDHGEMVPLHYLAKNLPENIRVLPIAYSYLDRLQHFGFGQIIEEVINSQEFANLRVAVIASGDLSHRLLYNQQPQFQESGKQFDHEIVEYLQYNKTQEILAMDEDVLEEAGECGYRSLLILLGALSNQKYETEILSYEGPFGVGYLVANFSLKEK